MYLLTGAASELTLDLEALKAKIADLRSSVQVNLVFVSLGHEKGFRIA